MADRRAEQPERDAGNTRREPDEWKAGHEPMTEAQQAYAETLQDEDDEEPVERGNLKEDPSRREGGRPGERGRPPLARQVAEHDVQTRVAEGLERIAASLEKIIQLLGRQGDQRRDRPRQDFRRRDDQRRDYGGYPQDREGNRYPEGNRYQGGGGGNRYQEGRGRPGRRRWGRDDTPR
jgi:hypothetical protein